MSYGRSTYGRDPRWITAKYSGVDAKGLAFKRGDDVFYFPATRTIYAGLNADEASRRFESERADEDCYNGYGSPYAN